MKDCGVWHITVEIVEVAELKVLQLNLKPLYKHLDVFYS